MTDRLTLVSVTVPVKEGDEVHPVGVSGALVRPGLAITPALTWNGFSGGFKLTHVQSGHSINSFSACMGCIRDFVREMPDFDWDRPAEVIQADDAAKEIDQAMKTAFSRCDGWTCDLEEDDFR